MLVIVQAPDTKMRSLNRQRITSAGGKEMSATLVLKAFKWSCDAGLSIRSCTFLTAVRANAEFRPCGYSTQASASDGDRLAACTSLLRD